MGIIGVIIIGGLAGWLASILFKGKGSGLLVNVVIGIIGGLIGGWVLGILGLVAQGTIGSFVTAVIGAVVLLAIVRAVRS
jgi:uncharacterized membrane protein YeaQ/YmgE (transglycosylase-associated protein family)